MLTVRNLIRTFDDIALRRPELSPHCYHILGASILRWIEVGVPDKSEKNSIMNVDFYRNLKHLNTTQ